MARQQKRLPAFRRARARDETHWSRKDEGAMSTTPHRNVNRVANRQRIAPDEAPDNSRKMTIGKNEIFLRFERFDVRPMRV